MSSRKAKAKKWIDNVLDLNRMNTERLKSRWFSIHITKDAFRTKVQKKNFVEIEKILKSRDVKPSKPIHFTQR